eukprot:TRINITY_DN62771_c0_g1_i1.p1 TRINITY_DN62771_c0_g1~~TRINITY_DN62771_c0_g1_i1.p1  ORF type:complete len:387 (-),score=69.13 TRINITY_DN62771_c0_g1_i1:60-1220(-)
MEKALWDHLAAAGARSSLEIGYSTSGERGLVAGADLEPGEVVFVPSEQVLDEDTVAEPVLEVVQAFVAGLDPTTGGVYKRFLCLVVGFVFERHAGESSRFARYLATLPRKPPPVLSRWSAEEQAAGRSTGVCGQCVWTPLSEAAHEIVKVLQIPVSEEDVNDAFWLVLTRMTYLRMPPWVDLINAARPGEHNASLRSDEAGHHVDLNRRVRKGEEVLIDYNHHDAISMMANYGCSLGMEKSRTVTKIDFSQWVPLLKMVSVKPQQLLVEDDGLPPGAVPVIRRAALGVDSLGPAHEAGYFNDRSCGKNEWRQLEEAAWSEVANGLRGIIEDWRVRVGSLMENVSADSTIGAMLLQQHTTEQSLLESAAVHAERLAEESAVPSGVDR